MSGLIFPALTQDSTGRPVLFGGVAYDQSFHAVYHNDIFRWDGTRWSKINVSLAPPGREIMQATYDATRQQTIMYGGIGCGSATPFNSCPQSYLDDTWTWDGNAWTAQTPAQNPGKRAFGLMAFDPGTQMSILFSGVVTDNLTTDNLENDTWSWDGTNWTQLSPPKSPGPLISSMMTTYPPDSGILLFGGQQDNPDLPAR